MAARIISARELAPDLAIALVDAILALPVGLAGEAGQGRQRALEKPQDFAETDRVGRPEHDIAAADSAPAREDAGFLEVDEDLLKELVRNAMPRRDLGAGHGPAGGFGGDREQSAKGIFRLVRDHTDHSLLLAWGNIGENPLRGKSGRRFRMRAFRSRPTRSREWRPPGR